MALTTGHSLSFYEILGPLGAGAMGEVYRAKDTRLDREVAIKVLPEHFVDDEERLRRFEREAKSLASLNHPNVAQIFGVDQVEDTCFLVLELVSGETLEERIARGALPVEEAVDVCRQIAEGLEAAHEAGVIHRDLKPANVVITPEGKVKVLDFGLAKPVGGDGGTSSTSDSLLTTEEGRLLGTPTYMAPEQARGKPIDKRVDVWAFGCVLYECLTGRRAFEGETLSDVLAAVLGKESDWSALSALTPARLRELLQRCLCKEPRQRLRDVGDARILLEELGSGATPPSGPEGLRCGGNRSLIALLGATTVAATVAAVWIWRNSATLQQPRIAAVNNLSNSPVWTAGVNWSPRGETIAYSEMTERGLDIFVKRVAGGTAELIVDSEGDDVAPRFSPDGKNLAFVSSSRLGAPVLLIDPQGGGTARLVVETGLPRLDLTAVAYVLGDRPWYPDGRSLLVSIADATDRLAIYRVDIETGEAVQLSFPGSGEMDFYSSLSFDAERIVFNRRSNGGGDLWTMPAEGGECTPLLRDETACFAPAWRPDDQRVVFVRSVRGGYYDLWEIDTESKGLRQITFETRRVWNASVAEDDRIAFCAADHDTFLHSVARTGDGEFTRLNSHTGDNFGAAPAPEGSQVAYHSNRTGNPEIWLLDLDRRAETQLTDNPATDLYPNWSPTGEEIVFVSNERGPFQLHVLDVERRTRRLLVEKPLSVHGSNLINARIFARWSPGNQEPRIAFTVSDEDGYTLWTVRTDGSDLQKASSDVYDFDWYLDSRRGLVTRQRDDFETDLLAVNLATGESRVLATIPHTELVVAPDGTAVSFCSGPGHMSMDLFVLELEHPKEPDGLPTAVGEPVRRTDGEGRWHAHNGGWTPDSRTLVFTKDEDYGDAYELIESRSP